MCKRSTKRHGNAGFHNSYARHVGNAVVKNDSRGHRIVKEHKDSARRIDLAVAAVMAHVAASTTALLPQIF
jgi:phage terminase large subunit-like protein